eukprot:Em0017g892a
MEYEKTRVTSALQLSPGDHLRIDRQGIYDHHMLVVEAHSANSFKVIHYTSLFERGPGHEEDEHPHPAASSTSGLGIARNENGERIPLGVVAEETLTVTEEDLKSMQVLRYPGEVRVFSVEESITRARSRLNEKDYHLVTNNCECFVNWAITGEAVSYQVVSGTMAALKGAVRHAKETYNRGVDDLEFLRLLLFAGTAGASSGEFTSGDIVRVLDDGDAVRRLQVGHGGWRQTGKVVGISRNGDVLVAARGGVWRYNPLCLTPLSRDQSKAPTMSDKVKEKAMMLMSSAISGETEEVRKILKANPKLDKDGDTALHYAVAREKIECISLLLEAGANPTLRNGKGFTAMHEGAKRGTVSAIELFIKLTPQYINDKKNDGYTMLHLAALNGNVYVVNALAASNASEQTALHVALVANCMVVAEQLVGYGADINAADNDGDTVLHYAFALSRMAAPLKDTPQLLKIQDKLKSELKLPTDEEMSKRIVWAGSYVASVPLHSNFGLLLPTQFSAHTEVHEDALRYSACPLLRLRYDGLLVGQVAKKGSTRRQVSVLSSWMEAWNILHSDCAQTALELVKYQHIICQLFAPDGSNLEPVPSRLTTTPAGTTPPSGAHGASHPQVLGPRLWWRALCQGLAMCCTSGPVISSEFTPLYDQLSHTTL